MFFYKKLKKTLLLEPMFLGPNFMQLVRDKIFSEVEGTCIGKLGYIVSVSIFFIIFTIFEMLIGVFCFV